MNIDVEFCREYLQRIVNDVRNALPGIKVNEAWTWHFHNDQWEFHGRDKFYWTGNASNAYDARAKGWEAYLRHTGKRATD